MLGKVAPCEQTAEIVENPSTDAPSEQRAETVETPSTESGPNTEGIAKPPVLPRVSVREAKPPVLPRVSVHDTKPPVLPRVRRRRRFVPFRESCACANDCCTRADAQNPELVRVRV